MMVVLGVVKEPSIIGLVDPGRFELPTFRLSGGRSTTELRVVWNGHM